MEIVSGRARKENGFWVVRGALVLLLLLLQPAMVRTSSADTTAPATDEECVPREPGECPPQPIVYVKVKSLAFTAGGGSAEKWRVEALEDKHHNDNAPAKIRFCTASRCQYFTARSIGCGGACDFQSVKELSSVPLPGGGPNAISFLTEFFGGGSGSLDYLTLWAYRPKTKQFVNILPPKLQFTNLGEYKLFSKKEGLEGILVTADFIWTKDETHYDPHRYEVEIYKYDPHRKSFALYKKYKTKSKYSETVIMPEMKHIRRLINASEK